MKQAQFHVLLLPDVLAGLQVLRGQFRCIGVREAGVDVEDQVAPAPPSAEFDDSIPHYILRVDLQSVRKAAASDDPGLGTPAEIHVHCVGS